MLCDNLEGWEGVGGGREVREGGDICMCCAVLTCSVVYDSFRPHGLQPARLLCPWNSPGKNTGLCSCSLLQGIFPTGTKPRSSTSQADSYHLSHQGSPRILEWVAYPFSRGSFRPRNQSGSPEKQEDFLPSELPGKPIYTTLYIY